MNELTNAYNCLEKGGIILYPTDTIWGIGCKTTDAQAIQKIYALKQRPDHKAFIVLVDTIERLLWHVPDLSDELKTLLTTTSRPTSVIYSNPQNLPQNILAEDGSIAIRIVQQNFCQELIKKIDVPLISTSANISGESNARFFKDISPVIKTGVDYVVDATLFPDAENPQSSQILKLSDTGELIVLRK